MYMTSITVKFRPSSIIQKEGTLHYQIIHHRKYGNFVPVINYSRANGIALTADKCFSWKE